MARKIRYADRCLRCSMRHADCLCPDIPRLEVDTRLVVIMHWTEILSTTNTGRLASLALPNSEVRLRGHVLSHFDDSDLCPPERTSLILYPGPDAVLLTPELVATLRRPLSLIVPDGTWRQAAKVARREPALAPAIRVSLPPGPPSIYVLRRAPQRHCVSTLEAIARAMGILEGKNIQLELEKLMRSMVTRTLATRTPDSRAAAEKHVDSISRSPRIRAESKSP